jgi:hypothetical protein
MGAETLRMACSSYMDIVQRGKADICLGLGGEG